MFTDDLRQPSKRKAGIEICSMGGREIMRALVFSIVLLACPWLSCRCCFKLELDDADAAVSWRFNDGIDVPREYEPRAAFPLDFPLTLVWLLLLPTLYADPCEPTSHGSEVLRKCRTETLAPL